MNRLLPLRGTTAAGPAAPPRHGGAGALGPASRPLALALAGAAVAAVLLAALLALRTDAPAGAADRAAGASGVVPTVALPARGDRWELEPWARTATQRVASGWSTMRGDRWELEDWARAAAPGFSDYREDHRP